MDFNIFEVNKDKYCYYPNNNNDEPPVYITNCYITDFIREIEPNGLIEDNYIIKWTNGQTFTGNKNKIVKDLINSNIFYERKIIYKFIDQLFASNLAVIQQNIKGTYLNQKDIQEFTIDEKKLEKAVELYNSLIEFVPVIQKELCKACWVVPVHYILKETVPTARGIVYAIVTNGVTGASKTSLLNLHKLMFELEYNAPKLEDAEPLGSYAGIRNNLSSQAGFSMWDEMDNILVDSNSHFNNEFRNLLKNVFKIFLPNVADKEKQGHNTNYYYLGTPIVPLNVPLELESAEKERILYFNMVEKCDLKVFKTFTKDDFELLREIARAYYNVVKKLDFSNVKSELEVRRLIIECIEQKYNVSFNLILKTRIDASRNDNNLYEKLLQNINYHCNIKYDAMTGYKCHNEDLSYFDWAIITKKKTLKINSKLFNQYISKLLNDYTINYSETCRELGFPKKKSIRWINQKTTDGYSFKSVNEFLEMLNFKDYIEPEE